MIFLLDRFEFFRFGSMLCWCRASGPTAAAAALAAPPPSGADAGLLAEGWAQRSAVLTCVQIILNTAPLHLWVPVPFWVVCPRCWASHVGSARTDGATIVTSTVCVGFHFPVEWVKKKKKKANLLETESAVLCCGMGDLEELAATRSLSLSMKMVLTPVALAQSARAHCRGSYCLESKYFPKTIYSKRPSEFKLYYLDLYWERVTLWTVTACMESRTTSDKFSSGEYKP